MTVIAFYLPQFHPIPENDRFWGRGFTEWSNVTRARPLFQGHHQPNLPADLGFYDLRVPESRIAQAELASKHGIDAFCYYHYWFGNGKRVLERPFEEVLSSGRPDFPFMLCWANQSWSGVWHGTEDEILIRQEYPGAEDDRAHFEVLLKAFRDPRYLKISGKPVFMIYQPRAIPNLAGMLKFWRSLALEAGFNGLYLLGEHEDPFWDPASVGLDAFVNQRIIPRRRVWLPWSVPLQKIKGKMLDILNRPTIYEYRNLIEYFMPGQASELAIPCVLPNWDNTPRCGFRGVVLQNSTPELFAVKLRRALERYARVPTDNRLLFIKSWNEWAEGNYLEPDQRWGLAYLEALKTALADSRPASHLEQVVNAELSTSSQG